MHLQDETAEPLFFEPPLWSSKPLHDPPDRPEAAASSMRLVFWSKGGAAMNLVNESQMTGTLLQVRHRSSFVWTIATHGPCWAMLGQRGGPGRRFTQDSVCIVSLHSLPFLQKQVSAALAEHGAVQQACRAAARAGRDLRRHAPDHLRPAPGEPLRTAAIPVENLECVAATIYGLPSTMLALITSRVAVARSSSPRWSRWSPPAPPRPPSASPTWR